MKYHVTAVILFVALVQVTLAQDCIENNLVFTESVIDIKYEDNIQFLVDIKLPNGTSGTNTAKACASSIVARATKKNDQTVLNIKNPTTSEDFEFIKFENLPYFTQYDIQVGYEQSNPSVQTYYKLSVTKRSCFGTPSPVRNINFLSLSNGSLLVKWDVPEKINAPNVCSYSIKVRNVAGTQIVDVETKDNSLTLSKDKLNLSFNITIYPINSKECYAQSDSTCSSVSLAGNPLTSTYQLSSTTTANPTTTTKSSSSNLRPFSVLIFSIFILFKLYA